MNNIDLQDTELLEQLKNLTIERLNAMPKNTSVVIGAHQHSIGELVEHVVKADELGRQIMNIQLEFLQDLATGEIYKDDNPRLATQA